MFVGGATSGWCVFHRGPLGPGDGAEIVRQSRTVPYLEAIKSIQAANNRAGLKQAEAMGNRKRLPGDALEQDVA